MTGWTYAKYLLALAGVVLVLAGESTGRRWVGYIGLGLLVAAFLLRFVQRARARKAGT
jgi:hypothetical protein